MTMTKMTGRAAAVAMSLFLLAAAAFAHGNEQHVIGTVTQVTDAAITVKTTANEMVTVAVGSVTEFSHGAVAAKFADLKVGDRVVIHAMKHGDQLMAHTVQFTVRAAAAAKKPN